VQAILIDDLLATEHAHFVARRFLALDHQADRAVAEGPETLDLHHAWK